MLKDDPYAYRRKLQIVKHLGNGSICAALQNILITGNVSLKESIFPWARNGKELSDVVIKRPSLQTLWNKLNFKD